VVNHDVFSFEFTYKFFNLSGGAMFWVILNCSIFALKVLEFYKDFIVKDLIDDQNEANLSEQKVQNAPLNVFKISLLEILMKSVKLALVLYFGSKLQE
jgi:hypothetical protein